MRILFVSHSGVLKYHQKKLRAIASKYGHEVFLTAPPYWTEGGIDMTFYRGDPAINYVKGRTVIIKNHMVYFYLNAESIVKKIKPDIVHIEEEPVNAACCQFVKAAKKNGIKTVFFTWENILKKHNPLYAYFEKYTINHADAAIAGNEEAKQVLLAKGFKKRIKVMPQYGLDLEDYKRRKMPDKITTAAYAGRLTPEKGIETLLEAMRGTVLNLNIAGTGDENYTEKIAAVAGATDLRGRINFEGHVKPEDIPGFMCKADILVLPSLTAYRWKEQFGRVLIEAMAAGTAVIGSSSGEIPNVIGDAGLTFREGDAEDLKDKLNKMSSDRVLYERCVSSGHERVKNNFTNDIIAAKIDSLYRQL